MRVSGEKMCKIVFRPDFIMIHRKGSHTVWMHKNGRTTTIPLHSGKELPGELVKKILKDTDLSIDEYLKMR